MTLSITHSTVVAVADDGTSPVGTNEWNAAHTVSGDLAGIYPAAATEASIRAAAVLANAAGGGIVQIPVGNITLTQPLIAYNNVTYQGAAWSADFRGGRTTAPGGTILTGDGTFIGYTYNATDGSVAPTDYTTFVNGMLNGAALRNLSFVNFSYGVKVGSKYNPGAQYFIMENVAFIACTQWGFWFENYQNSTLRNLQAQNNTVGQIARVCSGFSADNGGNSEWIGTFATVDVLTARGIVTWARFSSSLNNDTYYSEQVNSGTFAISQAATMANTSTNITVTDSTKFPVGMPVTVSATANNFTANKIYFVVSSFANVVSLSLLPYDTAIPATGNTAVNLLTKGFSNFEIAGIDAASTVTSCDVYSPDFEGTATARVLLINAFYGRIVGGYIGSISGTNDYITFCKRNSEYRIDDGRPFTLDSDTAGYGPWNFSGGTVTQSMPYNYSQTWNNSAISFRAFNINVTDTASEFYRSYLLNLQTNGVDIFSFAKKGLLYFDTYLTSSDSCIQIGNKSGDADSRILFRGTINGGANAWFDWGAGGDGSAGTATLDFLYFRTAPGANAKTIFQPNGVTTLRLDESKVSLGPLGVFGFTTATGGSVQDIGLARNAAGVLEVNNGTIGTFRDLVAASVRGAAVTFANRPATPVEGMMVAFTDSTTAVWGNTITGTGANHVLGYYNGTNWTVAAK
jgi:hypothetical protein